MLLAEITWGQTSFALLIALISFLLICLILLQKNRGSGLSGAFGGAGGQSAFGTKTGDVLTWVTVGLTAFFLLLCVVGNWYFQPGTMAQAQPTIAPAGQTPNAPTTTTPPATSTPPANKPAAANQPAVTPMKSAPVTVTPTATPTPAATQPAAAPTTGS